MFLLPWLIFESLKLEEKWVFFTCPKRLFLSHATKTLVPLDKNSHKSWLQGLYRVYNGCVVSIINMSSKKIMYKVTFTITRVLLCITKNLRQLQ